MEAAKASFFSLAAAAENQLILEPIPAFLPNSVESVQNVGHLGRMNPANGSVINVRDLKKRVKS